MSEVHNKETLDRKMRQIEALLATADHPNTPAHEAASARALAERLMVRYRIEEEDLIKSGNLRTDVIDVQMVRVAYSPLDSEFSDVYRSLLSYALAHTGCHGVFGSYERDDRDQLQSVMEVFGYEADIRYATLLFSNARLLFADRMEPKPDSVLSDEDNVYRMRSAGMERIRIADMMGWGRTNSATAKVTRLYKKACAARGEDATLTGRGNNVTNFRDVYVDEFKSTFWNRLWEARNAVEAEIREGGIMLHDREGRVKEALYVAHPSLRPQPRHADAKVKVRKPKPFKITKAMLKEQERRQSKAGRAGAQAGTAAANEVTIQGQTPKRRLEN